ncbi:MAG: winged helix-turn-helix domain-containing protein [Actinomycetota bacterium]|nr:winged helix-turn-helix domain-containing protein [Actinomycetota bacterium]
MKFRILGPVEARAAGQSTALGRGHRRTILAALLAAGGDTVTTDRLIDAVWPHDPPASARKSLQSHLSRLRAQLSQMGSSPLVSEPDGYRVDLERYDLDAARFESLVARARESRDRSPAQAVELLLEALELWRGPAFGDLADHPAIRAEAVRLENLRATAAAEHTDVLLALGRHAELIGELERTIAEDPLSERPHGQLMVALYRSGRQGDALATYRALQDRLRDELGVDPSPELRDLHERILRQDPALDAPPASRDQIAVGARRPPPAAAAPDLIGRADDIASIAARIEPGCLVTLTGPGGVGKTRLAEQVADRVADRFDDGLAVATLAATRDPGSVGDALITALGIQPTGEQSAAETLITALGERQLLLLLDNCEHVLGAVTPLVDAILGHCPNVAILATSRERLHLAGERLWPVAPLPVPDRDVGPEEVAATPAGALFRVRAVEAEPSFALTDANAPAVAALCRGLDGMPLAIELAAARARAMAPEDLVARLDRRFSLLAGGPRHEAGRHRTLQAVVAWSYDLLDPLEARLFDRLSVFAGTFSLESAEQVCAGDGIDESDVAGLMGELVDKSMVVVERRPAGVRYRLLDTLREYGTHRLAAVDDPEIWRCSHADHHVQLAERLGPLVRGPEEGPAVVELDAVFDDLRAAHAWLVGHKDPDGALRIPAALGDYLVYRLRDEVTTWACRAVALPCAAEHPWYALALTTAAFGATSRDECDRAEREAEEALAHAAPDSMAAVAAEAVLTTTALYEGRIDDMLRHAAAMAAAAERLAVPFYVAYAGVCRVIGRTYRGQPEKGLSYLPGLQEAAEASGSPTMRAFAHYSRGEALLELRPREAAAALEEAVRLAREVDNALIWGVSLVSLASLRGRLGETQEALRQFRQIIAHWRRLGDHTHQLTTLRNLVVLLAETGTDEPAAVLYGAVTAGVTPSFGLEAQRLDEAWTQLETRLGSAAATTAAERGRTLRRTQVGRVALGYLDELIGG